MFESPSLLRKIPSFPLPFVVLHPPFSPLSFRSPPPSFQDEPSGHFYLFFPPPGCVTSPFSWNPIQHKILPLSSSIDFGHTPPYQVLPKVGWLETGPLAQSGCSPVRWFAPTCPGAFPPPLPLATSHLLPDCSWFVSVPLSVLQ